MNNKKQVYRGNWLTGSSTSIPKPVNGGKREFPIDQQDTKEVMAKFYGDGFC
tara:strand:+ start:283 stop:438 length:156 start_codon:yes stop_codon:yes gene_type:complete